MRVDVWRGVHAAMVDAQRLHKVRRRAAVELPADWLASIGLESEQARRVRYGALWHRSDVAARRVYEDWLNEYGGAVNAELSDAEIKSKAATYASEAETLDIGRVRPGVIGGAWGEYVALLDFCNARGVDAPHVRLLLAGMGARVRCKYWWRRALRRMVARRSERGAMALGLVCQQRGQSYASNKAVFRRIDQNKRNREAMENTALENEDGQRATLAELAARSTSNKAIRRGELMTRIRGCEEIADSLGMVGMFYTLTCPSRFHSTKHSGKRNSKHDGSTPRDAQKWLCLQWARVRASLDRAGIKCFGFRVAEPHHDGAVHWHALLWFDNDLEAACARVLIRQRWLSDDGLQAIDAQLAGAEYSHKPERGSEKYRMNAKRMDSGSAAGYIAKYIAKNIDDHGIDSHLDDYAESPIGADLLGDVEIKTCMRVEAWAGTWGIRQFQPIGQPPVGVWRELRRVAESRARDAGIGGVIHRAWGAAHSSWAGYVKAQGGMVTHRHCNIAVAKEMREVVGRYETAQRPCVMGVRINITNSRCIYSERRLWRVIDKGADVASSSSSDATKLHPRSRVNNCTYNRLRSHAVVLNQVEREGTDALQTEQLTDFQRILQAIRRREKEKIINSC